MWFHFWCPCGRAMTVNGHGVCRKCNHRMVVSFQRELVIDRGEHARQFVPHDDGKEIVRKLHSDEKITGSWFPMQPGLHKEHPQDRRRRPESHENGPVIVHRAR